MNPRALPVSPWTQKWKRDCVFTRSLSFSSMGALGLGGTAGHYCPRTLRRDMPKLSGAGVWEGPRKTEAMV